LILVWLIPQTNPDFIIKYNGWNGIPLYAFLIGGFSTLIQFFLGSSFYIKAFKGLRNKSATMDLLVVLGTSAAWGYAFALIFVGYDEEFIHQHEMYHMQIKEHVHNFEISSVLITVLLLGKFLETISKKKTVDKLA
jgi:P-type Cu+ transporter